MKKKFPYSIRKSLVKVLPFMATAIMATSCQKEHGPKTYPETIYVPFEWGIRNPNMDTIKFYANKPEVKKIVMDLAPMDSLYTSNWYWRSFDSARDTLQKRIDIASDKVCGRGTIIVYQVIPDSTTWFIGLPRSDSTAFAQMGFDIYARRH